MFVSTQDQVKAHLENGLSKAAVARRLGISKPTVSYHARRLGYPVQSPRRYDWELIRAFYDAGHSVRECQARFGFHSGAWSDAIARGDVVGRPRAMSIEELVNAPRSRGHLKKRLVGAGLLEECCQRCGISEWRERRIALELHHVNGNGQDNRLENLVLLCPNCHSQTESWGGRNSTPSALQGSTLTQAPTS
jgi:HNH endonuclease